MSALNKLVQAVAEHNAIALSQSVDGELYLHVKTCTGHDSTPVPIDRDEADQLEAEIVAAYGSGIITKGEEALKRGAEMFGMAPSLDEAIARTLIGEAFDDVDLPDLPSPLEFTEEEVQGIEALTFENELSRVDYDSPKPGEVSYLVYAQEWLTLAASKKLGRHRVSSITNDDVDDTLLHISIERNSDIPAALIVTAAVIRDGQLLGRVQSSKPFPEYVDIFMDVIGALVILVLS